MIPDLRPRRVYPKPLPTYVVYVYAGVLVFLAYVAVQVFENRSAYAKAHKDVLAKQSEMQQWQSEIAGFRAKVAGLQASQIIRDSSDKWKDHTTAVAALQASVLASVVEVHAEFQEAAKKVSPTQPKPQRRGRPAAQQVTPTVRIRSLSLEVKPDPERADASVAELKVELEHNVEARRLITAVSNAWAGVHVDGLALKNFRPEDRGPVVAISTTWRKSGGRAE